MHQNLAKARQESNQEIQVATLRALYVNKNCENFNTEIESTMLMFAIIRLQLGSREYTKKMPYPNAGFVPDIQ
jgi:hypothetical protein